MLSIKLLFEDIKIKYLYRSGPEQNIKIFSPQKNLIGNTYIKSDLNKIYATDDISFAAGFCFYWSNNEGFNFGRNNYSDFWTLKIPKKFQKRLNNKCSMYIINGNNFKKLNIKTSEYISNSSAKVIKEIKFKNCWDCLLKYNINIEIIK
jgi:hypothetical protein